jgi:hypothetical protein
LGTPGLTHSISVNIALVDGSVLWNKHFVDFSEPKPLYLLLNPSLKIVITRLENRCLSGVVLLALWLNQLCNRFVTMRVVRSYLIETRSGGVSASAYFLAHFKFKLI